MSEIDIFMLVVVGTAGLLVGGLSVRLFLGSRMLRKKDVAAQYVHSQIHEAEKERASQLAAQVEKKDTELRDMTETYAAVRRDREHLEQRILEEREHLKELREHFESQFQLVANKLLEEKSERFSKRNDEEMRRLLEPMRQRILEFEENVVRRYREDMQERGALKEQISRLSELNTTLSQEANALTAALKGDSKTQGDWGELRLELILEKAGLMKDVHYKTQLSFRDDEQRQKRPDVIVHLPNDKHLIIDSKVSLTAYEQYYQASDEAVKKRHLNDHLKSIRNHIRDLSGKNYQGLAQLNTPDYLLLFIPIEPAFNLAMQEDNQLFVNALDKKVILVTSSTLLATMSTVSFIWTQEKQKQNVLEIATQSGKLYDQLCTFVENLEDVGRRLSQATESYNKAFTNLDSKARPGGSILGRAEKIRALGAKTQRRSLS